MIKTKSVKMTNQYFQASYWKRFLAFLIDILIVNVVVSLPFYSYLIAFKDYKAILYSNDPLLNILLFFVSLSLILYFSILEYSTSQTIGKMLFRINVVSLDKKLTFKQTLLSNITIPFTIILLLDVLYLFFKNGNQRLFELFARVMVVEKRMKLK